MALDDIRDAIPEYARDLKLNLGSVLTPQGAPGLNERQIWSIALACAIASGNVEFARKIEALAREKLDEQSVTGARAAAAIMGMTNVYYRFTHLVAEREYETMRAGLRMNVMAQHGSDKAGFELASLAVSAINGCGKCVDSHEKTVRQHGVSAQGVQSAVRIASVIHAVAVVLEQMRAASSSSVAVAA